MFCSISGHTYIMGEYEVYPRIILISDGRPTDFTNFTASDLYGEELPHNYIERVRDFKIEIFFSKSKKFRSQLYPLFKSVNIFSSD